MIVNLITSEKIADDLGHMFGIYLCVWKQFARKSIRKITYTFEGMYRVRTTLYYNEYDMNNVWKIKI